MSILSTSHHLFCSSLSTHRDGSQESLGHVSHHNGHEEDHGFQESITDKHCNHKEREAEEDGKTGDDVNEVFDLYSDRRLLIANTRRQTGDSANNGSIPSVDNHTGGYTCKEINNVSNLKTHV